MRQSTFRTQDQRYQAPLNSVLTELVLLDQITDAGPVAPFAVRDCESEWHGTVESGNDEEHVSHEKKPLSG